MSPTETDNPLDLSFSQEYSVRKTRSGSIYSSGEFMFADSSNANLSPGSPKSFCKLIDLDFDQVHTSNSKSCKPSKFRSMYQGSQADAGDDRNENSILEPIQASPTGNETYINDHLNILITELSSLTTSEFVHRELRQADTK